MAHTLHYDLNGAITRYDAASGDDKWVTWNARQLPTEIVLGDSKTTTTPTARDRFQYGPNGNRFYRETSWWDTTAEQLRTERTFILGNFEEQLPANDPDYQRIEKTTLDANVAHIAAYHHDGGQEEFREYLHRDHLGSVEKITDETGLVILDTAFEPFGARRGADWQSELSEEELQELLAAQGITTRRGFTGHEHLDRTGLIHMNGRVYDPTLGRFLSPDPIVQAPTYSQSWNRYTYVFNSPMTFTDPSGFVSVRELSEEEDDPIEEVEVVGRPLSSPAHLSVRFLVSTGSIQLANPFAFNLGSGGGGVASEKNLGESDEEEGTEKAKNVTETGTTYESEVVVTVDSDGNPVYSSSFTKFLFYQRVMTR
ncbi:RHS repeat-associated core domain-containing protein, partial [Microbulbifer sp.]|uniref:RHS repeat-associated core domain-containing protein n=1 Tax=Microbulbifer sp. TaxID=1908541 RepID=UPI003F3AE5B6